MEKVIILSDASRTDNGRSLPVDPSIVNNLLDEGWTVKHLRTSSTEHKRTLVFVLEKKDNE